LDFVSTTNKNVAITFPKYPGFSPNFGNNSLEISDLGSLKDQKLTLAKLSLFEKTD